MKNPKIPFVKYYLKKYAAQNYLILDIGCATAQYRDSTRAHYCGLDITTEPYKEGYPRDIDLLGSAQGIPLLDNTFDLVFCVAVLYLLENPQKALKEFHRVLKNNGRVIIFDYNKRTQKRLEHSEGHKRPRWTQWGLKRLVEEAGFRHCELLLPLKHEVGIFKKYIRLIKEELRRQWAIVTGVK